MPNYDVIDEAITDEISISGRYTGDPGGMPRLFLPYVLGTSEDPDSTTNEPMVLCYQYGGFSKEPLKTPHPHPHNWKCFRVLSFVGTVTKVTAAPPFMPASMNGKQRKRQNCVQTIENFANHN
jgi:hypothetical protein